MYLEYPLSPLVSKPKLQPKSLQIVLRVLHTAPFKGTINHDYNYSLHKQIIMLRY